jgi:hypothetical protein
LIGEHRFRPIRSERGTINLATGAHVYDFDLRERCTDSLANWTGQADDGYRIIEIAPVAYDRDDERIDLDSRGAVRRT